MKDNWTSCRKVEGGLAAVDNLKKWCWVSKAEQTRLRMNGKMYRDKNLKHLTCANTAGMHKKIKGKKKTYFLRWIKSKTSKKDLGLNEEEQSNRSR